ncbi:FAD-dependent oxidoreductase [Nonomuraea africana]|uniref:NADPH-dependent 2,4-dienoyl-CoA reductase/sulfur reductase-like enzyme n=1 Tax=Nonomuraea africana TaxID=46171 RepID=A0ABR9KVB6_9ACTN|nr:FAD-dependent oxidoreductase [Nonomuraea africana]MBE1565945.1 NADPH-dependent 2,4-dienoyl-CoA reductase/sulfur reductase-like enzyme [Nonomuraea africana]
MHLLVIGGSDAGIEAGLAARSMDPGMDVTLLVADRFPNFSICGIPYHVSGDVPDWRDLAHQSADDLKAAGLELRLGERAVAIDPAARTVLTDAGALSYDRLVIGTGAMPLRPPIQGLDELGAAEGVHELHTMDDTLRLMERLDQETADSVIIIGAGYIGLEMAEALSARGARVTVLERFEQVMPRSLDPELAAELASELGSRGVEVQCGATVASIARDGTRLAVTSQDGRRRTADLVLVVTGVRPSTELATGAGARLGAAGAVEVDRRMRTGLPDVYAAGDCVQTYHRLLGRHVYLPLGTTAHKQGRVAGEDAAGGDRVFAGVLGTQVVKVFDRVAAATGLRDAEAAEAGFTPTTVDTVADDHKAYYPGATPIRIRLTGDRATGRLLGAQLVGHLGAEIAKRIDVLATGIHHGISVAEVADLDLSYTPPLGSPWDALQQAARQWSRLY